MKMVTTPASVNTILLVSILFLSALYQSELGGGGSVFNSISLLLALIFIFYNLKFNQFLTLAFSLPLFFLLMSIIVNNDVFDSGGYHRVISMTVGYLLLMLSSFQLNKVFIERCVFMLLLVAVTLSLGCYLNAFLRHNTGVLVANGNFNGNPNAASLFFFSCLILSAVFVKGKLRWAFMSTFVILILTTASRAGFLVAVALFVGFVFFDNASSNLFKKRILFEKKTYRSLLRLVAMVGMLYIFIPGTFSGLEARLADKGLDLSSSGATLGRSEIWASAFELSQDSLKAKLFGVGPGTAITLIGRGMHSSYVDAIISVGWLFLIATLLAILCLFYYHKRQGNYYFIFFAVLILIYGAFETSLFNGMGSIWWIFIFLSLYYRSHDPQTLENSLLNQQVGHDPLLVK